MIAEFLIDLVVQGFVGMFAALGDLGLNPTWPNWVVGTGTGTIQGSFEWIASGISPFAAWVNLTLMATIIGLFFTLQSAFITWALLTKVVLATKAAVRR